MLTSEQLAALPVKNGFRLRGLDMTRIETFTDAAFAFALTLLVISGDPPANLAELTTALKNVPAFICSALLLMVFWYGHNEWSRRYGLDDAKTVILSSGLVLAVLVYVYPLNFVARGLFTFIAYLTGWPVSSRVIDGVPQPGAESVQVVNQYFTIYGVGFAVISAIIALLHMHAWSRRRDLQLNASESVATKGDIGAWLIMSVVGLLSVICAVMDPFVGAPGYVYMLLPFIMPVYGARIRRRLKSAAVADASSAAEPPLTRPAADLTPA